MADYSTGLEAILRSHGKSITSQRQAIFKLLAGQESLSMNELVALAGDRIDRASVYRTIALFEEVGIVRRINIGWKYKIELSDNFAEHHHHLTCLRCRKITPINEHALESFIVTLAQSQGFAATDHQVEIQGLCHDCQTASTIARTH